jgi:LacI family transcriptional regulator
LRSGTKPTLADVAALSGVSTSTVSNVVRGATVVAPRTRRKVLEAIQTLGYRPNVLARSLVKRQTNTIGLVLGDLSNPFYSELTGIIVREASTLGYATMMSSTGWQIEAQRACIEKLLEHRVGGIIALQFSHDPWLVQELRAVAVPFAVVTCWEEQSDCVAVDDERAGALVARHLLDLGHRRVAYVTSALVERATDAARLRGFRMELAGQGVHVGKESLLHWRSSADFGNDPLMSSRLRELVGSSRAPTAFFVSNDIAAVSLMETLDELDLRVPEDVSVVGFDNIAVSGLARVSLTTVAQPREELGRIAMQLLVDRLMEGEDRPLQQVRLEPQLIIRRSAGPVSSSSI